MAAVVEAYLDRLQAKDWVGMKGTLADTGFERVGPFCDEVSGRDRYLQFLEGVVSRLDDYRIRRRRITAAEGVVYAEIDEAFVAGGSPMEFPEVLVFDLDPDGLIRRVQVYLMRPGEEPPVPGGKAGGAER